MPSVSGGKAGKSGWEVLFINRSQDNIKKPKFCIELRCCQLTMCHAVQKYDTHVMFFLIALQHFHFYQGNFHSAAFALTRSSITVWSSLFAQCRLV